MPRSATTRRGAGEPRARELRHGLALAVAQHEPHLPRRLRREVEGKQAPEAEATAAPARTGPLQPGRHAPGAVVYLVYTVDGSTGGNPGNYPVRSIDVTFLIMYRTSMHDEIIVA